MPPPYSYTLLENLWPEVFAAGWSCPPSDDVRGRHLDTSVAATSEPFAWAKDLVDVVLPFGTQPRPNKKSLGGIPMQRIPATGRRWVTFVERDTYRGTTRPVQVPVPAKGFWVEGNPNILQANGASGAWDAHVVLVCPETGEAWELIGCNVDIRMCLSASYWRRGELQDGHPVCKAGVLMSGILSAPKDPPHRRGFILNDYVGGDGTKQPGSGWPSCGDVFCLSDAAYVRLIAESTTDEQRDVLGDLHLRGARLYDRGEHVGFGSQTTATWQQSTLLKLQIRCRDLERVTT